MFFVWVPFLGPLCLHPETIPAVPFHAPSRGRLAGGGGGMGAAPPARPPGRPPVWPTDWQAPPARSRGDGTVSQMSIEEAMDGWMVGAAEVAENLGREFGTAPIGIPCKDPLKGFPRGILYRVFL